MATTLRMKQVLPSTLKSIISPDFNATICLYYVLVTKIEANLTNSFGRKFHDLRQGHEGWFGEPSNETLAITHGYDGFSGSAKVGTIPESL